MENSYYFSIPYTEFRLLSSQIGALVVTIVSAALFITKKEYRVYFLPPFILMLLSFTIPSFTTGLPGIRRFTGILTGFYWVGIIAFWVLSTHKNQRIIRPASLLLGLILLFTNLYAGINNAKNLSMSVTDWTQNKRPHY